MVKMLPTLSAETIEAISKVLDELTNSEITHELQKVGIVDHSPGITHTGSSHLPAGFLVFTMNTPTIKTYLIVQTQF